MFKNIQKEFLALHDTFILKGCHIASFIFINYRKKINMYLTHVQ